MKMYYLLDADCRPEYGASFVLAILVALDSVAVSHKDLAFSRPNSK